MPQDAPHPPNSADPAPSTHDPNTQSAADYAQRQAIEAYFAESIGSNNEKLENFAKYVPRQSLARFLARYELFKKVLNVHGSIIECGVQFGGGLMSFAKLSAILEPYNFQRRIFGFDTFTGFPEIHSKDREGLPDRKSAHLKAGGFGVSGLHEDLLKAVDVFDHHRFLNHFPKVHIVKGNFEDTVDQFLADYPHLVVSCLYLDFDIYHPTQLALTKFLPRIPKGGIVVFDELNEESFPGETLAVMERCDLSSLRIQRFQFEPRISFAVIGD